MSRWSCGSPVSNPRPDGESIRFDLSKPFQILSEMRENPEWRARVEEFRNAVREKSRRRTIEVNRV
jgi:hypothetical protein